MSDTTPPPGDPAVPPPGTPAVPPPAAPPVASGAMGAPPQNGTGTAALILGILGVIGCIPIIGGILGIVLGRSGMKKAEKGLATNGGVAKAGFWLGIIGLVLGVLGAILTVIMLVAGIGFFAAAVNEMTDMNNNTKTGLADGDYAMKPTSSISLNDSCGFKGTVYSVPDLTQVADKVLVSGKGSAQCGSGSGTPSEVDFTVSGGTATIVAVQ